MIWQIFRLVNMILMVLSILFGTFVIYEHVLLDGLLIIFTGLGGLIFFSFRLGRFWKSKEKITRD